MIGTTATMTFTSPVSTEDRRGLLALQAHLIDRLPPTIDVKMTHLNGIPCIALMFSAGTSKGQTWGVRLCGAANLVQLRQYDDQGRERWVMGELEQLIMDAEACAIEYNDEQKQGFAMPERYGFKYV